MRVHWKFSTILTDTTWIWLDAGSPVGPDGYVNFQGDGRTGDENICAHMSADGYWIHSPCDNTYGYVCQTPAGNEHSQILRKALHQVLKGLA